MNKRIYSEKTGKVHTFSIDTGLCEVSLAAPTQLQNNDEEDLTPILAEVWLKLRRERIPTGEGYRHLTYAFKTATLYIECTDCAIDGRTRSEVVAYKLTEKSNEQGETVLTSAVGGELSAQMTGILKAIDAKINARADLSKTIKVNTETEGQIVREYRSIWSSGAQSWCLVGVTHPDGIITDRICGDVPICSIKDEGPGAQIRARLVVDMRDLWTGVDREVESSGTPDALSSVSNNRKAVCNAIVKRGKVDPHVYDNVSHLGEVELARATLRRETPSE